MGNDRSQLGNRDSEVAIVYSDTDKFQKPGFVKTLRSTLMSRYLGISKEELVELSTPKTDKFFEHWKKLAKVNEDIYFNVFLKMPRDRITKEGNIEMRQRIEQMGTKRLEINNADTKKLLQSIQGYLIKMPLYYLEDENLHPQKVGNKLTPVNLFT